MTANFDFDDTPMEESPGDEYEAAEDESEAEEAPARRRNPLRLILLVLVILVLLCLVCFLISRFIPIPGITPQPTEPPPVETPTPLPTDEGEIPPTEEPLPTDESQLPPTETAAPTEEPGPTEEPVPTEEPGPTEEPVPTEETVIPPTGQPGEEPTATTEPVPGPTSTPAPTIILTVEPAECDGNQAPMADPGGPYQAMMGKGQAIVNFDGSNSSDPDGAIESYTWDFGDDSAPGSGATVSHGYTRTGTFTAKLTVTDNCQATAEATVEVTIVGPTPPVDGTVTPTPPGTPEPPPGEATLGFCHLVQYGQTLSGIAAYYGLPLRILAEVNGVSMNYYVIAGQGLFIPVSQVGPGPNVYEAQPGDTLNLIAYHCGLPIRTLAAANNLDPGAALLPGQQLIIPLWRQVFP